MNKEQVSEYNRNYAKNNKERIAAYMKEWRAKNPEKIKEYKRREYEKLSGNRTLQRANNRRKFRNYEVGRFYGITPEEYDALIKSHNNQCAICKRSPETDKYLCVDHDHKTGKIRGLLCRQCNTGIGNLRDDPTLLRHALAYLESHTKDTDHETK